MSSSSPRRYEPLKMERGGQVMAPNAIEPPVLNRESLMSSSPHTKPTPAPADRPRQRIGFGRRNVHCSNCGDERGGPFGHEIGECRYRSGMTAADLAETMPPEKAVQYWEHVVDRYFDAQEINNG